MFARHNEKKKNNVGRISRTFQVHNGTCLFTNRQSLPQRVTEENGIHAAGPEF